MDEDDIDETQLRWLTRDDVDGTGILVDLTEEEKRELDDE